MLTRVERRLVRRHSTSREIDWASADGPAIEFVSPAFVLSTGRCGTHWLSTLLGTSPLVWVNHSDPPELVRDSRLAFEAGDGRQELQRAVVRAARDEWLLQAFRESREYVETNNRITFLAPAALSVYPQARFLHIVRHPGPFIRSGLSRGWYRGHPHDIGRIRLRDSRWDEMPDIARIAWLWQATNEFVEDFAQRVPQGHFKMVRAEDMFTDLDVATDVVRFLSGEAIARRTVARHQRRVTNGQPTWAKEPYEDWPDADREPVRQEISLAGRYGYEL